MAFLLQRISWVLALALLLSAGICHAEPAQVVVGSYVNKIQDLDFRNNKYSLDFFVWFRWKPEGELAGFKPLESFELVNGKIEGRDSVVEKKIGDLNYASARITASMSKSWDLEKFPFDAHRMDVFIEDSNFSTKDLVFVADTENSRLGDEIEMPGWVSSAFGAKVGAKIYRSNYGDLSIATNAQSEFSRFTFSFDITRVNHGSAFKLLSLVLLATAVAFVAFMVKPSDLDARFGMGVGSLFAVAASAVVVSSSVPDSGVLTVADQVHVFALLCIFATLLQSAICLKLEVSGREELAFRIDRYCLVLFPLAFYGWAAWAVMRNLH